MKDNDNIVFLTTTVIESTKALMAEGVLGQITTPGQGNVVPGVLWGADNECFLGNYRGDEEFLAWLRKQAPHADRCVFANAPDVVGDYAQTLRQLQPMATRIRDVGLPASLVAQDGMTPENFEALHSWDDIDALFLGGTNTYKLGPGGREMVAAAKERGKWVHMGRVNSFKRFHYAHAIGCDSADGTLIAFAPSRNVVKMREWANALQQIPIDAIDVYGVAGDGSSRDNFAVPTTDATPAGARRAAAARAEEAAVLAATEQAEDDPDQLDLFADTDLRGPQR